MSIFVGSLRRCLASCLLVLCNNDCLTRLRDGRARLQTHPPTHPPPPHTHTQTGVALKETTQPRFNCLLKKGVGVGDGGKGEGDVGVWWSVVCTR